MSVTLADEQKLALQHAADKLPRFSTKTPDAVLGVLTIAFSIDLLVSAALLPLDACIGGSDTWLVGWLVG